MKTKLSARIPLVDHQVTVQEGSEPGQAGVYVLGMQDQLGRHSIDVRFFWYNAAKDRHRSTRYGVTFGDYDQALRCAKAIIDTVQWLRSDSTSKQTKSS